VREQVAMPDPGDRHHDEADQERHERRPDILERRPQGLAARELGHVDLEHQQRDDDREDPVGQGHDPRRVVRALVGLPFALLVYGSPCRSAAQAEDSPGPDANP
jgi:hypothetical protein